MVWGKLNQGLQSGGGDRAVGFSQGPRLLEGGQQSQRTQIIQTLKHHFPTDERVSLLAGLGLHPVQGAIEPILNRWLRREGSWFRGFDRGRWDHRSGQGRNHRGREGANVSLKGVGGQGNPPAGRPLPNLRPGDRRPRQKLPDLGRMGQGGGHGRRIPQGRGRHQIRRPLHHQHRPTVEMLPAKGQRPGHIRQGSGRIAIGPGGQLGQITLQGRARLGRHRNHPPRQAKRTGGQGFPGRALFNHHMGIRAAEAKGTQGRPPGTIPLARPGLRLCGHIKRGLLPIKGRIGRL